MDVSLCSSAMRTLRCCLMIGVELETLEAISVNFLEGPKDERDLNVAVEDGALRASDAVAKEGGRL